MPSKTYRLIAADGTTYESSDPGVLGGHKKSKIYGTLDCPGALRWISRGHYVKWRVFFASEEDAVQAGYRPCYGCLRAVYVEWKADPEVFSKSRLAGR
jgi:methylphosphotriester-DNA--protein-cysteine methyltransferase